MITEEQYKEALTIVDQYRKQMSLSVISGGCFWGHKWIKWEQYTQPMIARSNGQHYIDYRQRRTCTRCGKMQDELIP